MLTNHQTIIMLKDDIQDKTSICGNISCVTDNMQNVIDERSFGCMACVQFKSQSHNGLWLFVCVVLVFASFTTPVTPFKWFDVRLSISSTRQKNGSLMTVLTLRQLKKSKTIKTHTIYFSKSDYEKHIEKEIKSKRKELVVEYLT